MVNGTLELVVNHEHRATIRFYGDYRPMLSWLSAFRLLQEVALLPA